MIYPVVNKELESLYAEAAEIIMLTSNEKSENYINKIENRKALLSLTGFFYICDFLKIRPKGFFDFDNPDPVRASIALILKELADRP